MIKQIIFIACICVVGMCYRANAQIQFSIALKGGVNFSEVPPRDISTNLATGFHVGIAPLIKILKIGIQPELLFSRQGLFFEVNNQTLNAVYDYINVPIIIKFYLLSGLNIQLGPQLGLIVGAKTRTLDQTSNLISDQNAKDKIKDIDVGLAVGLGWDLPFGLTIAARYNLSLVTVVKGVYELHDDERGNQLIQVSMGYKMIKCGK